MNTGLFERLQRKVRSLTLFDYVLYGTFIVVTTVIFRLYSGVDERPGDWNAYKTEHHCELGTTERGTQRGTWVCDDGKVHYRWRQLR
jgi:hypothetical protein